MLEFTYVSPEGNSMQIRATARGAKISQCPLQLLREEGRTKQKFIFVRSEAVLNRLFSPDSKAFEHAKAALALLGVSETDDYVSQALHRKPVVGR